MLGGSASGLGVETGMGVSVGMGSALARMARGTARRRERRFMVGSFEHLNC